MYTFKLYLNTRIEEESYQWVRHPYLKSVCDVAFIQVYLYKLLHNNYFQKLLISIYITSMFVTHLVATTRF
jgi:hypothetical protein